MFCVKCGTKLSEEAHFCKSCGSPVEGAKEKKTNQTKAVSPSDPEKAEVNSPIPSEETVSTNTETLPVKSEAIIHGYSEAYAINMKIKVYCNGQYVGIVGKDETIVVPITTDSLLKFKCSFRSAQIFVKSGVRSELKLEWDRGSGKLHVFDMQASNATENMGKLAKGNKKWMAFPTILTAVAVIASVIHFGFNMAEHKDNTNSDKPSGVATQTLTGVQKVIFAQSVDNDLNPIGESDEFNPGKVYSIVTAAEYFGTNKIVKQVSEIRGSSQSVVYTMDIDVDPDMNTISTATDFSEPGTYKVIYLKNDGSEKIGEGIVTITNVNTNNNFTESSVSDNSYMLFRSNTKDTIILSEQDITNGKEANMEVSMSESGDNTSFSIGLDSPNGVSFLGLSNGMGVNFAYDFQDSAAFDDYGYLNFGYFAQISVIDLDNDGVKEVVVSIGDKLIDMETAIYEYTGSKNLPFVLSKLIDGQSFMEFYDGIINVPYGSQGLFDEYIYKNGTVKRISE